MVEGCWCGGEYDGMFGVRVFYLRVWEILGC